MVLVRESPLFGILIIQWRQLDRHLSVEVLSWQKNDKGRMVSSYHNCFVILGTERHSGVG